MSVLEDAKQWELGCIIDAPSSMVLEVKLINGILNEVTNSDKL